jgi:hypothetical protein
LEEVNPKVVAIKKIVDNYLDHDMVKWTFYTPLSLHTRTHTYISG